MLTLQPYYGLLACPYIYSGWDTWRRLLSFSSAVDCFRVVVAFPFVVVCLYFSNPTPPTAHTPPTLLLRVSLQQALYIYIYRLQCIFCLFLISLLLIRYLVFILLLAWRYTPVLTPNPPSPYRSPLYVVSLVLRRRTKSSSSGYGDGRRARSAPRLYTTPFIQSSSALLFHIFFSTPSNSILSSRSWVPCATSSSRSFGVEEPHT